MRRCDLCERTTDRFAAVCEHIVHGQFQTYTLAPRSLGELPDTACTSCSAKYNELGDAPAVWETMQIHMVCEPCYKELLSKQLLPEPFDIERKYRLITAHEYSCISGNQCEAQDEEIVPGSLIKIGFISIPSSYPKALEKMWVRVVSRFGSEVVGVLDNDPEIIPKNVLHCGSQVSFRTEHVLAVFRQELREQS